MPSVLKPNEAHVACVIGMVVELCVPGGKVHEDPEQYKKDKDGGYRLALALPQWEVARYVEMRSIYHMKKMENLLGSVVQLSCVRHAGEGLLTAGAGFRLREVVGGVQGVGVPVLKLGQSLCAMDFRLADRKDAINVDFATFRECVCVNQTETVEVDTEEISSSFTSTHSV